jgi:hypothetical protein
LPTSSLARFPFNLTPRFPGIQARTSMTGTQQVETNTTRSSVTSITPSRRSSSISIPSSASHTSSIADIPRNRDANDQLTGNPYSVFGPSLRESLHASPLERADSGTHSMSAESSERPGSTRPTTVDSTSGSLSALSPFHISKPGRSINDTTDQQPTILSTEPSNILQQMLARELAESRSDFTLVSLKHQQETNLTRLYYQATIILFLILPEVTSWALRGLRRTILSASLSHRPVAVLKLRPRPPKTALVINCHPGKGNPASLAWAVCSEDDVRAHKPCLRSLQKNILVLESPAPAALYPFPRTPHWQRKCGLWTILSIAGSRGLLVSQVWSASRSTLTIVQIFSRTKNSRICSWQHTQPSQTPRQFLKASVFVLIHHQQATNRHRLARSGA